MLAPDADHVVRRFNENLGAAGQPIPSLAGQMRANSTPRCAPAGTDQLALGGFPRYIPLQQVNQWVDAGDVARWLRPSLVSRCCWAACCRLKTGKSSR
ncbi:hypothetical protein [Candidatus Aalborgicola defluviihabitans]|uniref:hypothetical protein n=1 Tax=Candidatus Aalborgicola defluviihabitans TaxID=3386187 RepID=UPI001ECAD7B9|nr:hypothetical protein [Burkholderiales bacterium]